MRFLLIVLVLGAIIGSDCEKVKRKRIKKRELRRQLEACKANVKSLEDDIDGLKEEVNDLEEELEERKALCAEGFSGNIEGVCYSFPTEVAAWSTAKATCEAKGGRLAVVDKSAIQAYLKERIGNTKGKVVRQQTPDNYVYYYLHTKGVDVTNQQYVTFKVKACNDAHIALSNALNVDKSGTYEVVIGGWRNSQSVIRECKQCANKAVARHRSLDCASYRPFWISWSGNTISVGAGNDVGTNRFMTWTDSSPHPVNYIAVATGWGASGSWEFETKVYKTGEFWTGGRYVTEKSGWFWTPFAAPKAVSAYTNWASGESGDASGNQHCLALDSESNMQWRSENCDEKKNFVCQSP